MYHHVTCIIMVHSTFQGPPGPSGTKGDRGEDGGAVSKLE